MITVRQFILLVAATIVVFAFAPFVRVRDEIEYQRKYAHLRE